MPDWVPSILQGLLGQILLALVIAMSTAIWGKLKKYWVWPEAIVYGAVLLAALLFTFNQIGWEPSPEVRIRGWLDNTEFQIQRIEGGYRVTDFQRTSVRIFTPKNRPTITFISEVKIGEEYRLFFETLSGDEQR